MKIRFFTASKMATNSSLSQTKMSSCLQARDGSCSVQGLLNEGTHAVAATSRTGNKTPWGGRSGEHSKTCLQPSPKCQKTQGEKGHLVALVALADGVHLAWLQLLSCPSPSHDTRHNQDMTQGWVPKCAVSGVLGWALPRPCMSPGPPQRSLLLYILYIALPCHHKGRFAQIRNNSMVSVSKKKPKNKKQKKPNARSV